MEAAVEYITQLPPTPSAILGLSIANAVLYLLIVRNAPSLPRTITKTASTALLAAFAASVAGAQTRRLIAALAFSAAGDALLAWDEGDVAFLYALVCFLSSHILYIRLFFTRGHGVDLIISETWRTSLAAAMALLAPGINYMLVSRVAGRGLQVHIVAYSVAILGMFLAALTMDNAPIVTGALFFATSDAILAADKFLVARSSMFRAPLQYAVWVLYYVGQASITLGLLAFQKWP
ncbi:unnamed protein product [Clonostachys chloroleuca]|uniref:Lysoplasmalogenase-like protein TMEM86A n=1 Tax=Clonostachys chloroleuca TaxID=1926264 RepID=A0AA35M6K9_9HYPO|nr:unnamed protein product [Clonostachys chloroleuca]